MKRRSIAALSLLLVACGESESPPPAPEGSSGSSDGTTTTAVADDTTGESPPADSSTTMGDPAQVTYHEHLRPLLERHCVGCHQPGNIAPFSLTTYEQVHPLREAIALAVEAGTMPPWFAGPDCRDYQGDFSMPPDEIELVRAWVDEGGAEGSPDDYVPPELPPPPGMSRTDLTLTIPEPYEPQMAPDDYRCFLLDWPYDQRTYVSGFSATPDQVQMVHHIIAFAIDPGEVAEYEALDAADPGVGYTCFGGPGGEFDIGNPSSIGKWLGVWVPGVPTADFPEGTGIAVEAGSKVVVQMHYNSGVADVAPDQTSVDFKIEEQVDKPSTMFLLASPDWLTGNMPIPAGEPEVVHSFEIDPTPFLDFINGVLADDQPFQIYSSFHHMHTLGTRARQSIMRADGSETCLLDMPRWDFNWQQGYRYVDNEVFNPGDRFRLECQWDNSAGDSDVNWGDGTGDEMCLGVFYASAL